MTGVNIGMPGGCFDITTLTTVTVPITKNTESVTTDSQQLATRTP